jgi:hypothetical protein
MNLPSHAHVPAVCAVQDEMKALQRLNQLFFVTGYLGFLTTWIFDLLVA